MGAFTLRKGFRSVASSAFGRIDLLAPARLKLVRFPAYSPLSITALPSMSLFPKSSFRPLGSAHLCRSHPCGSIRRGENSLACPLLCGNGANGVSDIEHARSGIARVDCNAARVAGASTGSASDQGKAATGSGERPGREASFNVHEAYGRREETTDHSDDTDSSVEMNRTLQNVLSNRISRRGTPS